MGPRTPGRDNWIQSNTLEATTIQIIETIDTIYENYCHLEGSSKYFITQIRFVEECVGPTGVTKLAKHVFKQAYIETFRKCIWPFYRSYASFDPKHCKEFDENIGEINTHLRNIDRQLHPVGRAKLDVESLLNTLGDVLRLAEEIEQMARLRANECKRKRMGKTTSITR